MAPYGRIEHRMPCIWIRVVKLICTIRQDDGNKTIKLIYHVCGSHVKGRVSVRAITISRSYNGEPPIGSLLIKRHWRSRVCCIYIYGMLVAIGVRWDFRGASSARQYRAHHQRTRVVAMRRVEFRSSRVDIVVYIFN